MAREYRILHHRQAAESGHWDLVENPIPHRSYTGSVPQGEGSFCAALQAVGEGGWEPVMPLAHVSAQVGESFILVARDS